MKNINKRKIRNGLIKSKGIISLVPSGLLNLVYPTGIIPEVVKKGIHIAITKIADEFDTGKLTELESDRYSNIECMAKMIKKHFKEIKVIFNNNTVKEM